jgi:hypothetical protein
VSGAPARTPKTLLLFLAERGILSDRKWRLMACAFFRRVWGVLTREGARHAVQVAEQYADGLVDDDERERTLASLMSRPGFQATAVRWTLVAVARTGAIMAVDAAGQTASSPPKGEYDPALWQEETVAQLSVIRDFVGPLPFRKVTVDERWRTPEVMQLAKNIYDHRDFAKMWDLAKALSGSGCTDKDLLHHCLWESQHERGCWALDAVLGKE